MINNLLFNKELKKNLLNSAFNNLEAWYNNNCLTIRDIKILKDLISNKQWEEINNRFYQNIQFGTGGMRGRTIGKIVSKYEINNNKQYIYPSVGSNYMNEINVAKATLALFNFLTYNKNIKNPYLVIAYDTRFFSKYFCKFIADIWNFLGGKTIIFKEARSTPQLSYTIRLLNVHVGIVITASHNKFYDNGYKVYLEDGGQIVPPDDQQIIKEFNSLSLLDIATLINKRKNYTNNIKIINDNIDQSYIHFLKTSGIYNQNLIAQHTVNVIYSPIHGTGSISIIPLFKSFKINYQLVEEQTNFDSHFSTVQSPNPEDHSTFLMSLKKYKTFHNADLLILTDPDSDRMGVAAPINNKIKIFTGNQIGSILAEYRINSLKQQGILPKNGSKNAVLLKTFVTTDLQKTIAHSHGIRCINTLTGFKWISNKLQDYELILRKKYFKKENKILNYQNLNYKDRAKLMLQYSNFCVLGTEESCGYLNNDYIRDKDANSSTILLCELFAYLKSKKITINDYLNNIYLKYGFFHETSHSMTFDSAQGSKQILNILNSYNVNPPRQFSTFNVKKIINFNKDIILDEDGKIIPKQNFYVFILNMNLKFAVRASGTEPKIKYYFFANDNENLNQDNLMLIKNNCINRINLLKKIIIEDALIRSKN